VGVASTMVATAVAVTLTLWLLLQWEWLYDTKVATVANTMVVATI